MYQFVGTISQIFEAYQGIFNVWLPQSSYKMDDRVGFDIYRYIENDGKVFGIDIYIPVS